MDSLGRDTLREPLNEREHLNATGIAASTGVEMLPANAKSKMQRLVLLSKECGRGKK